MSPAEFYAARLATFEAQIASLGQRDERIASARLIVGLLIVALILSRLALQAPSLWWTSPLLAVFVSLLIWHGSVRRARLRAVHAASFYRRGLDRINDRWMGGGEAGEGFADVEHVYATDLDLFGRGSLFELLCAARTRMGAQTLARWLQAPAAAGQILERQAGIRELRERVHLREDMHTTAQSQIGVQPEALLAWAESAQQLRGAWIRATAFILPALFVTTAAVWGFYGVRWPLLIVAIAQIGVIRLLNKRIDEIVHASESGFENLRLLSGLLRRIEQEQFSEPALQAMQRQLLSQAQPASRIIAQLGTISEFAGQRDNMMVRVFFEIPLMYSVHVSLAAEAWRLRHGASVRAWLAAVGRFEALSSLAMFAYEHPRDPFPELVDGAAVLEARDLGHPLLPAAACVRNDVHIQGSVRTLLVSGSNMSGKSTLLRAVGLNVVLAMAGAPVRASQLRLTPLQIGASIHINDSLAKGHSKFYAEIKRLRQIYELCGNGLPVLFLVDEMLQGTNSKDRRVGAEGVVRAYLERGAIGLISTHDLALTDLAGMAEGALRNVHFQDTLDAGRMSFDFKLRDGVVTKSNGIELMRAIGLKV